MGDFYRILPGQNCARYLNSSIVKICLKILVLECLRPQYVACFPTAQRNDTFNMQRVICRGCDGYPISDVVRGERASCESRCIH